MVDSGVKDTAVSLMHAIRPPVFLLRTAFDIRRSAMYIRSDNFCFATDESYRVENTFQSDGSVIRGTLANIAAGAKFRCVIPRISMRTYTKIPSEDDAGVIVEDFTVSQTPISGRSFIALDTILRFLLRF